MQLFPGRYQTINIAKYMKNQQQQFHGVIVMGKFRFKRRIIIVCSFKHGNVGKCCIVLPGDLPEQICTSWPCKPTSNECFSLRSWSSFTDNDLSCYYKALHTLCSTSPVEIIFFPYLIKANFLTILQEFFSVFFHFVSSLKDLW